MKQVVDVSTSVPRIGFTFSFPMEQTGIAKGRLLRWTKNYTCPGGVGSDPVKLLKEAFARKVRLLVLALPQPRHLPLRLLRGVQGVQVEVPVLANDTVALLAAGR